jgi:hypothetical protein
MGELRRETYFFEPMRRQEEAPTAGMIKDEIRKLSRIEKSEFHRSFDQEAAADLILKILAPGNLAEARGIATTGIPPVIKYRLLVGEVGIPYECESESKASRDWPFNGLPFERFCE